MNTPRRSALLLPAAWLLSGGAFAGPVDYARDIQPLLQEHCYECHGPEKQKNGFRLDRRSGAFSGLLRHNINPGHSETSRVYLRTLNGRFGIRMPPNDELSAQESELLRRWIDEGAVWPDELANESPPAPLDPAATDFVARLRVAAKRPEAQRALRAEFTRSPGILNARGPDGATPLMYIALYGDSRLLEAALDAGGDPGRRSDTGVMALHWAFDDVRKVRLLLDRGAPVDTPSGIGRTPLMLASSLADSGPTIELLLARGAKPTSEALSAAARANPAGVKLLLAAGAKPTSQAGDVALRFNCAECLAMLKATGVTVPRAVIVALPIAGPGDPHEVVAAFAHGGDARLLDQKRNSTLILAAASETVTPAVLQALIDHGANLQHRALDGRNALDYALRVGRKPIIEFFQQAGLASSREAAPEPAPVAGNTPRAAIERALPLLQSTSVRFYEGAGCVSCHSNTLTSMTLARSRDAGIPVDENLARVAAAYFTSEVEATKEPNRQGVFPPGSIPTVIGYFLMGLDAEKYPASPGTDALVRNLRQSQLTDGRWPTAVRPPQESSEFTSTAVSLRGIRLYGDPKDPANGRAVKAARRWLERNAPANTEDQVYQLFGLVWSDASRQDRRSATSKLLALQREDGGWAQLPWGSSDAYATGSAMMALATAGVGTDDPAWRRGIRYLLDTQLADGSWWVHSRSIPGQSYFESGFPHGEDQFISAAATNWAVQALATF